MIIATSAQLDQICGRKPEFVSYTESIRAQLIIRMSGFQDLEEAAQSSKASSSTSTCSVHDRGSGECACDNHTNTTSSLPEAEAASSGNYCSQGPSSGCQPSDGTSNQQFSRAASKS